jgi:DNA-binding NarL/FixJ family response regulator
MPGNSMTTMKNERIAWPGQRLKMSTRKAKIPINGFANPERTPLLKMNSKYAGGERRWLEKHMKDAKRTAVGFSKATRIVLADDHDRVRAGMRRLLEKAEDIVVVGEARDGLEAIELVEELSPDVLLLDMEMPVLDGNQVAENLHRSESKVRILAVSAYDDRQYIMGILRRGAVGYLTKDEVPSKLVKAVRGIARGEQGWVSKDVAQRIESWKKQPPNNPVLTREERTILRLVAKKKSDADIGRLLGIHEALVAKHIELLCVKLNIATRAELVIRAAREFL